MSKMKVGYLVGSLSKKSLNRKLAKAMTLLAPIDIEFVEIPIRDLPLYNYDFDDDFPQVAKDFKEAIAQMTGILFITPEYNRSIPGCLKNAIDWASRPYGQNVFSDKPSGVLGTSPSAIGTAVGQQHLKNVLNYCNSPIMNSIEAYIQFTPNLISDEGKVSVKSTEEFLQKYLNSFRDFISSFNKEREDFNHLEMRPHHMSEAYDERRELHYHAGTYGDDERIKFDALEAFQHDSLVEASQIDVIVNDGCITLRGIVESRDIKKAAERCVENISGVEDVRNELEIKRFSDLQTNLDKTTSGNAHGVSLS